MNDIINRRAAIGCLRSGQICGDYCRRAIEGLPPARQWIPVREGLPETGMPVLVTVSGGAWYEPEEKRFIEVGMVDEDGFWSWLGDDHSDSHGISGDHIVAWMPFPEPYKEE